MAVFIPLKWWSILCLVNGGIAIASVLVSPKISHFVDLLSLYMHLLIWRDDVQAQIHITSSCLLQHKLDE